MYCRKDIYSYMALEVGSIVEGTVTGLAKFGVFVEIADKKIGLVHISEVAGEYVSDVNDYLKLHDKVKVKIISVDEKGKIALSIKQAQAEVCGKVHDLCSGLKQRRGHIHGCSGRDGQKDHIALPGGLFGVKDAYDHIRAGHVFQKGVVFAKALARLGP